MGAIKGNIRLHFADSPLFALTVAVDSAVRDDSKGNGVNKLCQGVDDKHAHPLSGVNQFLRCPVCANDDATTFKVGRFRDGAAFVVDEAELALARTVSDEERKSLAIRVHPVEQVERFMLPSAKPYFLKPQNSTEPEMQAYASMVRGIAEMTGQYAFLTRFSLKGSLKMYRLGVYENALTLTPMAWPTNILPSPQIDVEPPTGYVQQITTLAELSVSDFDVDTYADTRSQAVAALLDAATPVSAVVDAKGTLPTPKAAPSMGDALAEAVRAAQAAKKPVARKAAPRKAAPAKATKRAARSKAGV